MIRLKQRKEISKNLRRLIQNSVVCLCCEGGEIK